MEEKTLDEKIAEAQKRVEETEKYKDDSDFNRACYEAALKGLELRKLEKLVLETEPTTKENSDALDKYSAALEEFYAASRRMMALREEESPHAGMVEAAKAAVEGTPEGLSAEDLDRMVEETVRTEKDHALNEAKIRMDEQWISEGEYNRVIDEIQNGNEITIAEYRMYEAERLNKEGLLSAEFVTIARNDYYKAIGVDFSAENLAAQASAAALTDEPVVGNTTDELSAEEKAFQEEYERAQRLEDQMKEGLAAGIVLEREYNVAKKNLELYEAQKSGDEEKIKIARDEYNEALQANLSAKKEEEREFAAQASAAAPVVNPESGVVPITGNLEKIDEEYVRAHITDSSAPLGLAASEDTPEIIDVVLDEDSSRGDSGLPTGETSKKTFRERVKEFCQNHEKGVRVAKAVGVVLLVVVVVVLAVTTALFQEKSDKQALTIDDQAATIDKQATTIDGQTATIDGQTTTIEDLTTQVGQKQDELDQIDADKEAAVKAEEERVAEANALAKQLVAKGVIKEESQLKGNISGDYWMIAASTEENAEKAIYKINTDPNDDIEDYSYVKYKAITNCGVSQTQANKAAGILADNDLSQDPEIYVNFKSDKQTAQGHEYTVEMILKTNDGVEEQADRIVSSTASEKQGTVAKYVASSITKGAPPIAQGDMSLRVAEKTQEQGLTR